MSVLVDTEIEHLVNAIGLIGEYSQESLEGASYDLRLGRSYVFKGEVHTLNEEDPTLVLEPGSFVVLTSLESLRMPLNLIGHNGIMSPWAKRGLVSLFSPQIDPGFEGMLTVPVFNAGDAPVSLDLGARIFTVEFARTSVDASYGWSERHGVQSALRAGVIPAVSRPSLSDLFALADQVRALEAQASETQKMALGRVAELELESQQFRGRLDGLSQRFDDFRENTGQRRTDFIAAIAFIVSFVAVVLQITLQP